MTAGTVNVQNYSGMQKPQFFRDPPRYPVESVDHALALMEMVRDFGRVRVSVAAELLGISVSTAHRLMAMLVYRGYAEQDASRRYVPGPAMGLTPAGLSWSAELRHRARTHMEQLTQQVGETSNLVILAGDAVRFLASVEHKHASQLDVAADAMPGQLDIVGDRRGVVLPADKASGGKAVLAQLSKEQVQSIFRRAAELRGAPVDTSRLDSLINELAIIRARGFAINFEATEVGVSAVAVAIHDGQGAPIAGLSVSIPQDRFSTVIDAGLIKQLTNTKAQLETSLDDFVVVE